MTNAPKLEFAWDPQKAATNIAKHGVTFDDAMTVFLDPLALSRMDQSGGSLEERWITIGMSTAARLLLVVHTHVDFGPDRAYIRIISARKPTPRERSHYEQGTSQS